MTNDDLKKYLAQLTNESTDENVISIVDNIMRGFDETTNNADLIEENTRLKNELDEANERFRRRFWAGAGKENNKDNPGNYNNSMIASDEEVTEFFKGI